MFLLGRLLLALLPSLCLAEVAVEASLLSGLFLLFRLGRLAGDFFAGVVFASMVLLLFESRLWLFCWCLRLLPCSAGLPFAGDVLISALV